VPANRSRTHEWRRCLRQVHERNGALEIAVANTPPDASTSGGSTSGGGNSGGRGGQLVWRVRILTLTDTEIVVEQPATLGQTIPIDKGIELVVVLAIGQNRWMFTSNNLGHIGYPLSGSVDRSGGNKSLAAMRLQMPESVQRCQRRHHYRVETTSLSLPRVEIWPLLDPKSVLLAERACELQFEQGGPDESSGDPMMHAGVVDDDAVMPEVGPRFSATLLNLGGGGVGLRIGPDDGQVLCRHKLFWMRIMLEPALTTPICATGKLVHSHIESNHDTYAGLAFDFSFNPVHQRFVVDQICKYIAIQQKAQVDRALRKAG
jgi:hypothetical protein